MKIRHFTNHAHLALVLRVRRELGIGEGVRKQESVK